MIPGPRPELTAIIAASDSPSAVARALGSLRGLDPARVEVIVAAPWPTSGGEARHVRGPANAGVPALRWLGLREARGRVVAFTEDSCLALPGWAEAWLAAFADPALAAASGRVDHQEASALDWAVVFCEYAPFLEVRGSPGVIPGDPGEEKPPRSPALPRKEAGSQMGRSQAEEDQTAGRQTGGCRSESSPPFWPPPPLRWRVGVGGRRPVDRPHPHPNPPTRLAGNNFAATREAAWLAAVGGEVHEVALLASVIRGGGQAGMVPGAKVRHVRRFSLAQAFGDRFRFGLEFGRSRGSARWLGLLAGPAILASQVAQVGRAASRSRHRGRFAACLPIALALLASWSLGEWAGWVLGPGSATKQAGRPIWGGRPGSGQGRSARLRRDP